MHRLGWDRLEYVKLTEQYRGPPWITSTLYREIDSTLISYYNAPGSMIRTVIIVTGWVGFIWSVCTRKYH